MHTAGYVCSSDEDREVVKYASCFWVVMRREPSTEVDDFTLTRKVAIKSKGARTANRHRWMRRES
jgi:myosin-crossreactive antigen